MWSHITAIFRRPQPRSQAKRLAEFDHLGELIDKLADAATSSADQADNIIRKQGELIDGLWASLQEMRRYYEIGVATVAWSGVEFCLDASNIITLENVPGGDGLAEELPRALDRKLELFERAYRELPALARFKADAAEIAREVKALKDHRHDFVHGVGVPGADGEIRVSRLILKGKAAFRIERPFPLSRIQKLRERMLALSALTADLTEALMTTFRAPH